MWKHIDFYFNTQYKDKSGAYDKYLNPKEQVMFERCIANIITDCRKIIKRKFYLWEPEPHCFFAIEINDVKYLKLISQSLKKNIKGLSFVKRARINPKQMHDETNGEDFIIVLNAFTEAYLFHRHSRLTHIIHCCMEFQHQTREKEIRFYEKMLALYGGEDYK
jgi:hypothetical protein